jgi:hypothetical protein
MTRYLFLSDNYVLVSVGRPLWREDESVFCMCRWPLPAQSFSGPSPLGLATVFYCLIWNFPFRRLLRLAGLRWRYSTPPPHAFLTEYSQLNPSLNQFSPNRKHLFQQYLYCCVFIDPLLINGFLYCCVRVLFRGKFLPIRCLSMNVYSCFAIPAFRRRVTILTVNNFGVLYHYVIYLQYPYVWQ